MDRTSERSAFIYGLYLLGFRSLTRLLFFELGNHLIDGNTVGRYRNRINLQQPFPGLDGAIGIIEIMQQDNALVHAGDLVLGIRSNGPIEGVDGLGISQFSPGNRIIGLCLGPAFERSDLVRARR